EPVTLLDSTSAATALIPTEEFHNAVGDAWRDVDFDTSDWLAGPAALGFEKSVGYEDLIDLDVGDAMYGVNQSIYARIPFQVSDPGQLLALSLHMRYDDGFAAYLNGTLVATRNGPANLTWNSGATAQHPDLDAREFEAIDISQYLSALRGGDNVLALHGLNAGVASNDFLLSPKLTAIEQSAAAELDHRYLTTPTPGATNVSDAFVELVADPTFSSASGVFDDAMNILLRGATPGAGVIYTLDGTIPSPTNGHWVTADSEQSVAETTLTVSMTSSIRALSVKDGLLSSSVATASYVILSAVATQPANPVGFNMSWAGYQADYGMDPDVINTTLPDYDLRTALLSLPSLVVATRIEDLFGASGIYANSSARGQERHASVELVDPNGGEGFQIDAGLQMHGNSSRDHGFTPKHPMRVLFKSEYGARKLRHQVFPDSTVTRFDELLLRGASTDSWPVVDGNSVMGVQRWAARHATYIRDQYMRDTQLALGHASGHGIYVHLYLDGLYWGVYNLAERPGDSFNAETFGGEKEEYDVIKDFAEVESGNATAWNQLMGLANAGLASEAAYQYIQGNHPDGTRNPAIARLLDVENLIDYMILHIYSGAEDWPHHNWWATRRRGPESEGFRFFVWDQEISNDSLVRMYTLFQTRFEDPVDSPSPSYLYGRLLANASFRLKFADRVQQLCFNRGVLSPEANYDRWMVRQQQLDHAIVAESARWGDARRTVPYKREVEWLAEMDFMREVYWPGVQAVALERFRRKGLFPEILAPELLVDGEPTSGGRVPSGAQLELLDANETPGTIYYTLDGVDPRMPISALETYVLATGAEPARYRVPEDATNDGAWFQPGFDDSAWGEGFAAIGFERTSGYEDEFRTDVGLEMFNIRQSVFLRVPFDVAALPEFDTFTLRMKYDDGFVAYLNGVPIASRNAPDAPRWDSGATTQHADLQALQFEDVDITPFAHLLQEGQNILAIQGLNAGVGSSDFLIVPEIVAVNTSGDLSPSALPYTGSLTLTADTLIRTRVKRSGEWSTLIEAAFTIPSALRISELMFHPPDASPGSLFAADDFEFVELINSGETPLTISGYRFTQGIEFTFADDLPALGPGERMLVVKNRTAFATRYGQGWNIAGEYEGQLSNGGERLQLVDAGEEVVLNFVFDDGWEPNADGGGRSLVIRDVKLAPETWSDGGSWTSSRLALGSPGLPENRGLGDANGDGTVDLIDLNAVRNSFGGFGFGDTDDDRDVDLGDLNAVRNYFGAENTSPIANRMLEGAVDIMEVRHLSTRTSEDERTRSIDELAHFLIVHERIRELPPSAAIRRNSIGMIAYCTRHFSSQST
ncbi:MAG: CotH kinase family protein, partial [Pirellulaceae bacterium]